ncbi:MAG TPA: histidine kinase [Thermoanaerobaculia bacterium]|nr:histidine kinase [Thermoanaerobaculia bacterium]
MSRSTAFVAAFWTGVALFLGTHTWLSMLTHGHSPLRIAVYHLFVWWGWALLTPLVLAFTRRFPIVPLRVRNLALHGCAAVAAGTAHSVLWAVLTPAIRPFDAMTDMINVRAAAMARFPLEVLIYVAVLLAVQSIEFYTRAGRLEESLTAAHLHALELQIQPHFLFNTLHAVSSLVRAERNDQAVEMIAGLSELLRYTLDHSGAQTVPLEKEAAILSRYLAIQRVRFADRLDVSIEIEQNAARAAVPALILQPLAENAIRHGVALSAGPASITVRAYRANELLHIEMFNSGTLRTDAQRGIGLTNTEERLRQLYAERYQFAIEENRGGGVLATIAIPWSPAT